MQLVALLSPSVLIASGALLIAIISLWCRPRWLWLVVCVAAVCASYAAGVMSGPAIVWLTVLGLVLVWYRRATHISIRIVSLIAVILVALLLGIHALPGFSNPVLVRNEILSPGAEPYTLYFNFDKAFVGILILGTTSLALPKQSSAWNLRDAATIVPTNVIVAMLLSLASGYVIFQPRWSSLFWVWSVTNLFLTCMSEEAFFRTLIQREVRVALGARRGASATAIAVSAFTFGLAHFAGGWQYVALATVAGAGYALTYERTGRVELSIAAHFILNATHFLFFTYPRLAS